MSYISLLLLLGIELEKEVIHLLLCHPLPLAWCIMVVGARTSDKYLEMLSLSSSLSLLSRKSSIG